MTDGLPLVWGATPAEVARRYPADDLYDGPVLAMTRAVPAAAPAGVSWRWLCQIAVAPYSYDWLDNLGRRSPTTLTPAAERLRVGQAVNVLRLTEVTEGHHWTGQTTGGPRRAFGDVAMTYAAEPAGPDASRMVCRVVCRVPSSLARARAVALAWGDLVMMRKQLLTLADLAAQDATGHPG
ncbi:MAG: hypothetical protein ABIQ15_07960 [Nocardioides sp.]